ncbi:MAG: DUF1491 family protein [Alphaproteobacteria bacterium]
MSGARLSAKLVASACLNAAAFAGRPAMVLRKGDPDSGIIFVKVLARNGFAALYEQSNGGAGEPAWRRTMGPDPVLEAEVDDRIARERRFDPDIWALEIMDDSLAHPLEPI